MADQCRNSLEREAAVLARRLELGRGFLLEAGSDEWSLWSSKNKFARPVGKASDLLVSHMRKLDRLKNRPGGGLILCRPAKEGGAGPPNLTETTVVDPDGRLIPIFIDEGEWALGLLSKRKDAQANPLIGEEQYAAAERLRSDYTLAGMDPRVTANWEAPIASGSRARSAPRGITASETALAAKQRMAAALDHVGPELSGILLEVCCLAGGLEHAERALGLPQRSGKAVLGIALTRLARHYRILPDPQPSRSTAGLRHCASPDYRPRII